MAGGYARIRPSVVHRITSTLPGRCAQEHDARILNVSLSDCGGVRGVVAEVHEYSCSLRARSECPPRGLSAQADLQPDSIVLELPEALCLNESKCLESDAATLFRQYPQSVRRSSLNMASLLQAACASGADVLPSCNPRARPPSAHCSRATEKRYLSKVVCADSQGDFHDGLTWGCRRW